MGNSTFGAAFMRSAVHCARFMKNMLQSINRRLEGERSRRESHTAHGRAQQEKEAALTEINRKHARNKEIITMVNKVIYGKAAGDAFSESVSLNHNPKNDN